MQNFVQRAFVGKASGAASTAQTVGQPLNLSTIVVGDLYLVDENGIVLDAASAATSQTAKIVRGTSPGKVMSSSVMKKGGLFKYTFQAYTAPVAQVTNFADLNLLPNTQYKLQVIIQEDLKLISNRQNRIEVNLTTTDGGTGDIDRLVTNFNKQRGSLSIITATRVGEGITLTGKSIPTQAIDDYEFVRFEANFVQLTAVNAVTGKSENLVYHTAIQPSSETKSQGGQGVAVQIRQIERIALGYSGFTDLNNPLTRGAVPYGAVDGVGYDMYNVQQFLKGENGYLQDNRDYPVSTFVAIVTGSAQKTAIGAALDAFLGVAPE